MANRLGVQRSALFAGGVLHRPREWGSMIEADYAAATCDGRNDWPVGVTVMSLWPVMSHDLPMNTRTVMGSPWAIVPLLASRVQHRSAASAGLTPLQL